MNETNEILRQILTVLADNSDIMSWVSNLLSALAVFAAAIPVIILLKERAEKKLPQFVVSYELVRDCLACVVLKNTGDVPLELTSLKFQEEWLSKLGAAFQEHKINADKDAITAIKNLSNTCVTFLPGQEWVLSFNVIIAYLPKDTPLEITYSYCRLPKKRNPKIITETVKYDLEHYGRFLTYKSDIAELANEVKKASGKLHTDMETVKKSVNALTTACKSMIKTNESQTCATTEETSEVQNNNQNSEEDSPNE